jgi:hypothetical protein
MPLAHFTNLESPMKVGEPIYKNLFEVSFVLPPIIQEPGYQTLLLQNATTVNLPTYPALTTQSQRFKYSTRLYSMMPDSTSSTDISITFNLLTVGSTPSEQNSNQFQIFTFKKIKDWYDLLWNNETGELNYKINTLGTITVDVHDKDGIIIRRVIYHNSMCTAFTGFESLSWDDSTTLMNPLTATFASDYWEDFYY